MNQHNPINVTVIARIITAAVCLAGGQALADVPTTLYEDNFGGDFNNSGSTITSDTSDFFSGAASLQIDMPASVGNPWGVSGVVMEDGVASLNELNDNTLTFQYKLTGAGDNVNILLGVGTQSTPGSFPDVGDKVTVTLIADNQWRQAEADLAVTNSNVLALDQDSDRQYRLRVQNFDGSLNGRTLNIDQVTLVPEPASMALLGLGGAMLVSRRRSRG